jgi:hypothetical protein
MKNLGAWRGCENTELAGIHKNLAQLIQASFQYRSRLFLECGLFIGWLIKAFANNSYVGQSGYLIKTKLYKVYHAELLQTDFILYKTDFHATAHFSLREYSMSVLFLFQPCHKASPTLPQVSSLVARVLSTRHAFRTIKNVCC